MNDNVKVSINKTTISPIIKIIKIEIRSDTAVEKIEMNQEDFANALFGLAEVKAKRRTKILRNEAKEKLKPCPTCKKPRGEDEHGSYICPCPNCGDEIPF